MASIGKILASAWLGACALAPALAAKDPSRAAKPVEFWVNSQTDEKYYLNMIKAYRE